MIKTEQDDNKKVQIPITLPGILKEYAKAVLREQPDDLVKWYFAEASRMPPTPTCPTEQELQLEIGTRVRALYHDNKGKNIDLNGCKSIYAKFSGISRIPPDALRVAWLSSGYSSNQFRELLALGQLFGSSIDRDCFCAMICGTLGKTLRETLQFFMEAASGVQDPDLQSIPFAKFEKICKFLMEINNDDSVEEILDYCRRKSNTQNGMISGQNIKEAPIKSLDD